MPMNIRQNFRSLKGSVCLKWSACRIIKHWNLKPPTPLWGQNQGVASGKFCRFLKWAIRQARPLHTSISWSFFFFSYKRPYMFTNTMNAIDERLSETVHDVIRIWIPIPPLSVARFPSKSKNFNWILRILTKKKEFHMRFHLILLIDY